MAATLAVVTAAFPEVHTEAVSLVAVDTEEAASLVAVDMEAGGTVSPNISQRGTAATKVVNSQWQIANGQSHVVRAWEEICASYEELHG
jgi:hypothetical protein